MPFPHKQVLITGATSGIGLALTERLLANNISVIAVARSTARLEALLAKHGPAHLAIEPLDVTDLASLPDWTARITATYPAVTALFLNAGVQHALPLGPLTTTAGASDGTGVSAVTAVLAATTAELTTNYLAPLHTTLLFLPHLRAHAAAGRPAALYYISKAALRALAWQVRAQLRGEERQPGRDAVRVVEIVPPAVQTELHTRQGLAPIGMPLGDFIDEMWVALESGEQDEILVGPAKEHAHIDDAKRHSSSS
ncbi:3-keto-steroid reductase like protein [Verticillium longisporum]|uniref:3-keto-steroid reductase like protein n=1 Tax=Verticillium longisporum TaxID=100787 RepID=A0A8I2ZX81_VERLO|nr:3-keto-steroid reductase like protein [Verticillium longisporum]